MFGFQRVGDLIWAAADQRARGLLIGATSGKTTLGGEGLQHQDGTSHLAASAIPNCRAWDPGFAYEVAVIVEHGMREMGEQQRDVFYYLTVGNENYAQPSMPAGRAEAVREGILKGMYSLTPDKRETARVNLMGAGAILPEVLAAARMLKDDWNIEAEVWSVTSFTELQRDAMAAERTERLGDAPATSYIATAMQGVCGPVVAATDYVRAVPELIRGWVPGRYVTLGTDGFGRSDTRQALRAFFEVDRSSIVIAALKALADDGDLDPATLRAARGRYGKTASRAASWEC